MSEKHLTQAELAARWRMSPRTLERWRWLGEGPAFLKLGKGGHVVYRFEDIEAYEIQHRRNGSPTLEPSLPVEQIERVTPRSGK